MELGQLSEYFGAMVRGVPLVFIVMGLVEWFKRLNIQGHALTLASMGIGLVFGGVYMFTQDRPPAGDAWLSVGYYFGLVCYGIGLGVVASGLYDVVKNILRPKPQG